MSDERMRRWIFAKRSQYKSKKYTPANLLWIWEEDAVNKLIKVKEVM